jgi:tetratricopeptide (TPR) repeat protein
VGRTAAIGLGVGVLAVVLAADGRASLYDPTTDHPDNTGMVPVNEKGEPEPLAFEEFMRRRASLRNAATNVLDPKTGKPMLSERREVEARIEKLSKKPANLRTEAEDVALAVDLLRAGRPEEGVGTLMRYRSEFLPLITLAHLHATLGEWVRAGDFLEDAIEAANSKPPVIPGVSSANLRWQLKLDREILTQFVALRRKEARDKPSPESELPDRLWSVNFVNDAGDYEPGTLAAQEKAKLPGGAFPEAIASVQQLVLWFPMDLRLYWLLGELYAARGDVSSALKIMNQCVDDSGRYSNRKVLMQHREAVARAVKAKESASAEEATSPPDAPFVREAVWIYGGAVAAVFLFALVRTMMKRNRSSGGACGPVG